MNIRVFGALADEYVLEKLSQYYTDFLNSYKNIFFNQEYRFINEYICDKNKLLPLYRSSLLDRVYKMKSTYIFDVINRPEEEEEYYFDEATGSNSSYAKNTSYGSYRVLGSYNNELDTTNSFASNIFRSTSFGSYNSYLGSYSSYRESYSSYMGSYSSYTSSYSSYAAYSSYGSYGSYSSYGERIPYFETNPSFETVPGFETEQTSNKIEFKSNIGYPMSVMINKKEYKNQDLVEKSGIVDVEFVTGYGLELI